MKIICLIYNSLIIAFTLSFICFRSVWLEMRINIGVLIPVFAVLALLILMYIFRGKGFSAYCKKFTAITLAICAAVSFAVLGAKSMSVVPASIVREALKMTHLKFSVINVFLIGMIVVGFIMIFFKRCEDEV